jgi:acyl-CoA synthetase (AMP-forming)/AMP-acid ligase II
MLVNEMIRRGAGYYADEIAVLFGDQRLTYREVEETSSQLAHALIARGLQPQDRVGLLLNNSQNSVLIDFACLKARLTRVPLNSRLAVAEQTKMLTIAGASTLVYGPDLADIARELHAAIPQLRLLGLGSNAHGEDLLTLAQSEPTIPPDRQAEPDDVVLAIFTSGTTGKLKAVQHTQASYAGVVLNILLNLPDIGRGDIMLHAASLIHASGTFVVPYWLRGGASAVLPGFTPGSYFDAIERWKPTALNMVPTMLGMLIEQNRAADVDMSSVRTIIYGASPMPRPVITRAIDLWGPRFLQYYGQTEAPLFISHLRAEDHIGEGAEARLLACGRPSEDCQIRLVDADGKDAAPGESGEIALRAPFQMKGYFNEPELNAATFLSGGFMRTRDVGRFDVQGFLYLVDRTSDMIVSGGYNIYPREVEDVLAAHPKVREVVVVGIPDDKWGEAVAAFVALRKGDAQDAMQDEADIIAFARTRLAGYKVPKTVRFIDEVPKSPVGKLLRRALRDPFWTGRERRIG